MDRLSECRRLRKEGKSYREAIRMARYGDQDPEIGPAQSLTGKDPMTSQGVPLQNRYEVLTDSENEMDVSAKEGGVQSRGSKEYMAGRGKTGMEDGAQIPRIMAGVDIRLANLKPMDRVRAIKDIPNIGVLTYRCMSGGDLILYPASGEQSRIIDGIQIFGGHRVKVSLPGSSTRCKGIIRGIHSEYSEQEVKQRLSEGQYEVEEVKFLKAREDETKERKVRTWTVLITFQGKELPKNVVVDFERFPVSEYKVNPIQCAKCCRFGHTWKSCRGKEHCHKCGESHKTMECDSNQSSPKCINCKGDHDARSKWCPYYKEADQIQKLARKGMSYRDAVKSVRTRNNSRSYQDARMGTLPGGAQLPGRLLDSDREQSQKFGEKFWRDMRIEIKRIVQEVLQECLAEGRIGTIMKQAVKDVLHPEGSDFESSP